jgi:hypothetical protein
MNPDEPERGPQRRVHRRHRRGIRLRRDVNRLSVAAIVLAVVLALLIVLVFLR